MRTSSPFLHKCPREMSRLYFLFLLIPTFSWADSNEDQRYLNEVQHLEADIERIRNEVAEM